MFAVIYQAYVKPEKEHLYRKYWNQIATYFIENRGAIGSTLHKSSDGVFVAYSRWPDKATRDASWPKDTIASNLPEDIQETAQNLKDCIDSFLPEISMEVIDDLLK